MYSVGLICIIVKVGMNNMMKGDKFNLNKCPKNEFERDSMKILPFSNAVRSFMYA